MVIHSIRWRFQLWLAFLLVVLLSGFGVTAHRLQQNQRWDQIDDELFRDLGRLSAEVRSPGMMPPNVRGGWVLPPEILRRGRDIDLDRGPKGHGHPEPGGEPGGMPRGGPGGPGGPGGGPRNMEAREIRISPAVASIFDGTDPASVYFLTWSRGGTVMKASTNAPPGVQRPERRGADTLRHARTRDEFREVFHFTERGECVLVGRSVAREREDLARFAGWLVAGGLSVLALGVAGGWWLVGRALQPVDKISVAATRIADGRLSERIPVADTESELGRLAGVLNATFSRLETAFAQQKQFTADAAHELRTPLAVLISEAQMILSRERTSAEYRESVAECLAVAQQMRGLIESLLQLARLDAGHELHGGQPVELASLARETAGLLSRLATPRGIRVFCDGDPVLVRGDAGRLAQVLTNLLSNAIHYNRNGGEVRVTTRAEGATAVLTVSDTGRGIPAADVPHVFERFFRVDRARARSDGHSGLGLAIVKAIVEGHGGTCEVESREGQGTTFTARLPRAGDDTAPPAAVLIPDTL